MKTIKSIERNVCLILLNVFVLLSLSACGGGSGMGYKEDTTDRAPYFSVGGQAVGNGDSVDAQKTESLVLNFFDDVSLASYDFQIDGEMISNGEFSGTSSSIEVSLDDVADGSYSARLLAIDSANQSTIIYFTINIVSFYQNMSLVGDATPGGWDTAAATPLTKDENIPGVLHWEGELTAGEFKISTLEVPDYGISDSWIHPLTQGQSLVLTDYVVGGPDNKWVIPQGGEGTYSITINQAEETIVIGKPLAKLFVVGDATPGGWSLDNATEFQRDPDDIGVFSLTVALSAGEFKFSNQTAGWDQGKWLYAPSAGAALPTVAGSYVLRAPGDPDNKWSVSGAQAGTYTITVDLDAGTIVAVPQ